MSQENVETARRFYEAVERALAAYWENPRSIADALEADERWPEVKAVYALIARDAVWNAGPLGTYRGHLEIASGLDDLFDVADYRMSACEFRDCGDGQVVAIVDRAIKATASGIDTKIPVFVVITVRDDLIAAIDEYVDRSEALEAAGLRDWREAGT